LAAIRILAEEQEVQDNAVTEAADAARIAENEYRAGTVDYTTVVTAQVTELNNRQTSLTILENRLAAAVTLIEALGGGWSAADLPAASDVLARAPAAVR
ncbi:MAG TPA: TolC family protein, partial [Opitutus sp.]|nr:TolC family protein [Opitutus sp.]